MGYFGIGAGQMRFYKGDDTGQMAPSTVLFNIGTDFGISATVGLGLFDVEGDGDLGIVAGGEGMAHTMYTLTTEPAVLQSRVGLLLTSAHRLVSDAFDFDSDGDGDGDHDLMVAASNSKLHYVENLGASLAAPALVGVTAAGSIGVGAPSLLDTQVVTIDILPGIARNVVVPGAQGSLSVAVLGSAELPAYTIDGLTATFGPAGAPVKHVARPAGCQRGWGPGPRVDLPHRRDRNSVWRHWGQPDRVPA